jgi:hypothetical protein
MTMTRITAVVACGLGLSSCSSWSLSWPSFDSLKSKPATTNLTIESDPPGAEARTSQGTTCRTPCTLAVPAAEEFAVSYALNGYMPQSVTIRPQQPASALSLDGITGAPPTIEPNPVFVELKPAGPPPKAPPAKPKPNKKRPPPAPAAAPGSAAAPAPPPAAPAQQTLQSPFPPPPGGFTPTAPGIGR